MAGEPVDLSREGPAREVEIAVPGPERAERVVDEDRDGAPVGLRRAPRVDAQRLQMRRHGRRQHQRDHRRRETPHRPRIRRSIADVNPAEQLTSSSEGSLGSLGVNNP
jgi:hypothetical protein